jgi:cytochrome c553
MNSSVRLAMILGLQLSVGAGLSACGGEDEPEETEGTQGGSDGGASQETANSGTLQLSFSPMYSAFVEGHEAQVPVTLKDTSLRGKGATFTSSDTSIATVTNTDKGGMVTVKKEGTVTIRGALDGESGAAKLTITKFTEAQWEIGKMRYSKSELAIAPTDGSPVSIVALASDRSAYNANGACNTCHTAQAKTLKIENTPEQIAGYSDAELITIFTKGTKPEGVAQKTMVPSYAWGMLHSWTVTDEEKQGLIAFLRTQTPTANPAMVDYGIKVCAGAPLPTDGGVPMLCDANGKPISFGQGGGGGTDAGTTSTTTDSKDAGVAADAG